MAREEKVKRWLKQKIDIPRSLKCFKKGSTEILFERSEIIAAAKKLRVKLPKNIGDVLYSFRYRASLPDSIVEKAPKGFEWIIRPAGIGRYKFVLTTLSAILPSKILSETTLTLQKFSQNGHG